MVVAILPAYERRGHVTDALADETNLIGGA